GHGSSRVDWIERSRTSPTSRRRSPRRRPLSSLSWEHRDEDRSGTRAGAPRCEARGHPPKGGVRLARDPADDVRGARSRSCAPKKEEPSGGAMSAVLSIIAIAGLLVLIISSLRVQYAGRAQERQEADARARVGETQHQDSLLRRSQV